MDSNPAPQSQPSAPVTTTTTAGNGFAIAALVLGIIAFVFGWLGAFNILTAILAVVFALVAMKKNQSKGLWITGLVLGGIGLLTSLLVAFVFGAALLNADKTLDKQSDSNASSSSSAEKQDEGAWDLQAAYDKITTGMTKEEVEAATGKESSSCSTVEDPTFGKSETCSYGNMFTDKGSLSVTYDNDDKVSTKYKYEN